MPRNKENPKYKYNYEAVGFGRAIRETREGIGLTQPALAEAAEMNRGTLSAVEAGRRRISEDERKRLCDALEAMGCDVTTSRALAQELERAQEQSNGTKASLPTGQATRIGRREVIRSAGAGFVLGATLGLPLAEWRPSGLGWRAWVAEGDRHVALMQCEMARVDYDQALRCADSPEARLLIQMRHAWSRWHEANYPEAESIWQTVARELQARSLDADQSLTPEQLAEQLDKAFVGPHREVGLQAFASVCQFRGAWHSSRIPPSAHSLPAERDLEVAAFQKAQVAYRNWARTAQVLLDLADRARPEDWGMLADARQHIGRVVLEQGVAVDPREGLRSRIIVDPRRVETAVTLYRAARSARERAARATNAEADVLGLVDDWRHEARAQLLLAMDRAGQALADKAQREARALVGATLSRTLVHFALDEGRWCLACTRGIIPTSTELRKAENALQQTVAVAFHTGAAATLAAGYGRLAAGYEERDLVDEALAHTAAALLVWPHDFDTRDSRHDLYLLRRLDGDLTNVRAFLGTDSTLRDQVLHVVGHDSEAIDMRLRMVEQRMANMPGARW